MLAIGSISVLRRKRQLREWRLKRKPNSWGTLAGPLSKHNNSKLHNQHLTLLFSPCQPSATTLTQSTGNLRSKTTQGCLPRPQPKQSKKSCHHLRQVPHSNKKTKPHKIPDKDTPTVQRYCPNLSRHWLNLSESFVSDTRAATSQVIKYEYVPLNQDKLHQVGCVRAQEQSNKM